MIVSAVERELCGSGSTIDYRLMVQRFRNDYGLVVDKKTVHPILKTLDPESIERRSSWRLKRRKYYAKGPDRHRHRSQVSY